MACESADVFSIEFPRSGAEVLVQEADVRIERRHYARARFSLTEVAARELDEFHNVNTLAFVNVNQERGHRMVVPQDGITYDTDTGGDTVANVDLLDARQVLAQQSIEKHFKDVDVRDIVEFLLGERHDPEGVIQGFEFIEEGDEELTATTSWFFESGPDQPGEGLSGLDLSLDPFDMGTGIARFFGVAERLGAYTYNFQGETILEAMEEIMGDFGLNWWVSNSGILYIGPDGTNSQLLGSQSGDNAVALSRYTVTESSKTIDTVQLNGSALSLDDVPVQIRRSNKKAPRIIAEARAENINGTENAIAVNQSFDSLEDLERKAKARLYQELMDDISGSMEVNGLASQDTTALRNLNVGDYFAAGEGIESDCNEDVVTGLFLVTSVHHIMNEREGWNITVELGRIPHPESIVSTSVVYDPLTDKDYDSLQAYLQEDAPDQEDIPSTT